MKKIIVFLAVFVISVSFNSKASSLQAMIDKAQPNSTINIKKGVHKGAITINKPLKVICEKGAIIDGEAKDDVVTIKNTKNVILQGCILQNSGTHGWKMDSGIKLIKVKDSVIKNNKIVNCLYGIVAKTAKKIKIIGNEISSKKGYTEGAMGDAIRLWWSPDNLIKSNYIHNSRDITSMFSKGVVFENNRVENSHIGTMIVNSNKNKIIGFKGKDNEVSILINSANGTTIKDFNVKGNNKYRGVVFIEASDTHISNGLIENCTKGLVINLSPVKANTKNYFDNIRIVNNKIGIYMHTTAKQVKRNIFKNIVYKNNKTNYMDELKTHK